MVENKTIAYVGNFSFPYGNASGSRVLCNGKLLKSLGYEVIFIGLDNSLSQDATLKSTENEFEKFTYYNLPYPNGIKGWLDYKKKFKQVSTLLDEYKMHSVISYGSPALSLFGILMKRWCKTNKILFLADVVDWMGAGVGSLAYRAVKFIDNDYQKRILNTKTDGVICISSYLSQFYQKKGKKTIVIPPLVDRKRFDDLKFEFDSDMPIKLIYIGRPFLTDGRKVKEHSYKDRLDIVIDTLSNVRDENFIFNIYGLNKDEYLSTITRHTSILEELKTKIIFHGFIENENAIREIAKSDFTILFRHKNKMNTAGFPTKFSESLSCGTPIITTETSDLHIYLEEGKNGFFVNIDREKTLQKKLRKILSMRKEEILVMKEYCRNTSYFDYKKFKVKMQPFLSSLGE